MSDLPFIRTQRLKVMREERDAARAELARVQAELAAVRALMDCYNLGGWTDALAPMQRALAAETELAKLRERFERAPVVKVRGKVGEFATIVVSHDLTGKRVRLVVEDGGDA